MGSNKAIVLAAAIAGAALGLPQLNHLLGSDGLPLAQLDLSAPPPQRVALSSPDDVVISSGNAFSVKVTGDRDAISALRFDLDRETLAIGRASEANAVGRATMHVTMPPPSKLALSGPGRMMSDRLTGEAEVALSGPGSLQTTRVDAERMRVAISGSGVYRAGGQAAQMELAVSGSGRANLADLQLDRANVSITGAATAALSSQVEVTGYVGGSGKLTVHGAGRCRVAHTARATIACPGEPAAPHSARSVLGKESQPGPT